MIPGKLIQHGNRQLATTVSLESITQTTTLLFYEMRPQQNYTMSERVITKASESVLMRSNHFANSNPLLDGLQRAFNMTRKAYVTKPVIFASRCTMG